MKLHPSYYKMSKKELIEQLKKQIELNNSVVKQNYENEEELRDLYDSRNLYIERNREMTQTLNSAENALKYKEKVIEKYKTVLDFTIELP